MLRPGLLLLCLVLAGCGSGSKTGPSLTAQYQAALQVQDASVRAGKLITIAESQKKAGDVMGAESALSAARDAATSLADPGSRANSLNKVAAAYGRAGDTATAKKLIKDSSQAIAEIPDADTKIRILADLAAVTGQHLKNPDAAAEHLATAEKAASELGTAQRKVAAQANIAAAYSRIERPADSQRVLDQVLVLAREQTDAKAKAECLGEVAAAQLRMKQTELSQATFDEAVQAAGEVADAEQRGYALLHLSKKLFAAGRKGQAKELLGKAQDAALQVKDTSLKAALVEEIDAAAKASER